MPKVITLRLEEGYEKITTVAEIENRPI